MAQASVNTKLELKEKEEFDALVERMGLTTSAVLRNFVKSFNRAKGFPYDVNYPVSGKERESVAALHADIEEGTAKSYDSIAAMLEED